MATTPSPGGASILSLHCSPPELPVRHPGTLKLVAPGDTRSTRPTSPSPNTERRPRAARNLDRKTYRAVSASRPGCICPATLTRPVGYCYFKSECSLGCVRKCSFSLHFRECGALAGLKLSKHPLLDVPQRVDCCGGAGVWPSASPLSLSLSPRRSPIHFLGLAVSLDNKGLAAQNWERAEFPGIVCERVLLRARPPPNPRQCPVFQRSELGSSPFLDRSLPPVPIFLFLIVLWS